MADIKILMLTHNYPRYEGDYAGIFIKLLAEKLCSFGIKPVILAPYDKGCTEYEMINGVTIYRFRYADRDEDHNIAYRGNMHQLVLGSVNGIFKFKSFLNRWRKAALDVIEKEQIELVAGHWLIPAGIVMKTIYRKTRLPMILSSHGTDIRLMRKYFKVVYRYLKSFCHELSSWTVVSNFLREGIVKMDRSLAGVIEIVPMPHDETIFYSDETITRNDNLVVSVTRFTDQKRVDKLIQAMALLNEQKPAAKLALYGTGPLEDEIKNLVKRFGLEKIVSINKPVPQEQLREIYNQATIVVLNSFEEGFGLALSEAMLCGAPVIGTQSGGITDIIEHEKTGLLIPLDNPEKLAQALGRFFDDKELRLRLARQGQAFAQLNYTSEKTAERYAGIIKKALRQ